jgi:hypothetical protein
MDKHIMALEMVLRWWQGTKQCFTRKDKEWQELCEGERAIKYVIKRLKDEVVK